MTDELEHIDVPALLEIRDATKREIFMRIVPFNVVAESKAGPEVFIPGSLAGVDISKVVLRMDHEGPAAGKGIAGSLEERADGAYASFKVSKTARGDEIWTLIDDGTTTGVSPSYHRDRSDVGVANINGRRTRVVRKADLREVSTTWLPTWSESAVLETRDIIEALEERSVAETPEITQNAPALPPDFAPIMDAISAQGRLTEKQVSDFADKIEERMAKLEDQERRDITVPARDADDALESRGGEWMQLVLKMLSGERVSSKELEQRVAADLITTDNLGVVPDAVLSEIIGFIDPARPFMNTTRRLQTPRAGMDFTLPKIVTRPTVGVQAEEKDELTSTPTSITNATFSPLTIGGYGDISLQLLKRSDPSYLDLYIELLAEAYAISSDDHAVDALLASSGYHNGGTLDPNDSSGLGAAWAYGSQVSRRLTPDHIWLSTWAVAAFIDAKADGTNAPLYSNLAANFTATGGTGGTISGLIPVHVPALDDEAYDAIVGPSRGFAWAEDGTFTLQVDVPAKAGRDVALVGIEWFMPVYPAAFTMFTVAS